ncbi:hypothetical protein [Paraburkholderia sp. GAS32]|uniref:hypothetical protein n=1 Tax=Paraburkholderia sp. GAS32 TaxID=3035129 RepID=UPI003D1E7D9D
MNLIPSIAAVQAARVALEAECKADEDAGIPFFDRRRAISDPVITPFARALKAEGYAIKRTREDKDGCDLLDTCPVCRSRYLFTAIKDGQETKACPHCHDAAMKAAAAQAAA